MSIRLMSAVWELTELSQAETLVALALADHAGDDGRCWPSIDTIAAKARLKRRRTQEVIRQLEKKQLIVREERRGRANTNRYRLDIEAFEKRCKNCTLADKTCNHDAEKVQSGVLKRAVASAPEPSEPSKNHQGARALKVDDFKTVDGLNLEAWEQWIAYRRERRLKPYKSTMMADRLAELHPIDQRECVEHSMAREYQGLFPEKWANRESAAEPDDYYEKLHGALQDG